MTLYEAAKYSGRAILRKAGLEISRIERFRTSASRRAVMMMHHEIQTVLDVGANIGDYGAELREWGFHGRILAFEPTSAAFRVLANRAADDGLWRVFNCAIGAEEGVAEINVASNNGASSSLMPMLASHRQSAPDVSYVATEKTAVKTLDAALAGLLSPTETLMLKIDTQGFEHMVLSGAATTLEQIRLIECELSLVPLYDGQLLFHAMLDLLGNLGFQPVQFSPGFSNSGSGHCLQVDGVFARGPHV